MTTITIDRAVVEKALEALEHMADEYGFTSKANRIERWASVTALSKALNAPQPEPLALGVDPQHIAGMQAKIDALEQENDWIGDTPVRHAVSQRLVEIRLLLRDGHTKNINGGTHD